jgi:mRNA interferase RelE/StbE
MVVVERQVEKVLRRLPREVLSRVDRLLLGLPGDPRPAGCKKLTGYENLYRICMGDWRIVYAIEEDRLIVLVVEIAPRGQAYRDL